MDWQTFTISLLGSGVVAALITAIVNGLMNHRTQIIAIKESGLYAKRAEVLDEMMKRMERLNRIMGELVSPLQYETTDDDEMARRKKAKEAFNYFLGFYQRSRHYIPKALSDEIGGFCSEYKNMFADFAYVVKQQGGTPDVKKWGELIKKYENDFAEKRESIAEEFRKIIGVK